MIDYASLSEKEIARRIRSYEEKYGMPYARDNRQFDCDSVLPWEAGDLIDWENLVQEKKARRKRLSYAP